MLRYVHPVFALSAISSALADLRQQVPYPRGEALRRPKVGFPGGIG
jgi:hypothetical protein